MFVDLRTRFSVCGVHHTLVKRKKTGRERQSKGRGRDDSGRFEWTIRAGARRRVAFGAVRATARADVDVDVDVGTTRTTRTIEDRDARGGTAFSPRMVGRSFIRLARARNENESRQTRDDGWMTRTLGEVVRSSPSPGDGNVSSSRPRSRASSVRRRRRGSRLCFRDDDATSVMTHVNVGSRLSHWWRRDIVVVACVILHTRAGVILCTRVLDHVTSHNS